MVPIIIVPNYKGGLMLASTIEKLVRSQPWNSFRLVIVDNGSNTDIDHRFLSGDYEGCLRRLLSLNEHHLEKECAKVLRLQWDSLRETTPPDVASGKEKTEQIVREKEVVIVRQSNFANDCLRVIQLDRNYGYETAINVAIQQTTDLDGDYVLMGSDVLLDPDALAQLEKVAYAHDRIGIVGPKLYKWIHGRKYVVGGGYVSGAPLHHRGWDELDGMWHLHQNCPWMTFSLVWIKRKLIEDVGSLDMSINFYSGDSDYSRRAREKGWACVYTPLASAQHGESITVGLVRREIGSLEFDRRVAEEQRYHALKWRNRHVGMVELPAELLSRLDAQYQRR